LHAFQGDHPLFYTSAIFCVGYYVIYLMGSVVVFALGVLMPMAFIIAHASLR
jgi:hypothetical protein